MSIENLQNQLENAMVIDTPDNTLDDIFENFKQNVTPKIERLVNSQESEFVFSPTVFGRNDSEYIEILKKAHKARVTQMKEGKIAQIVFGNFNEWEDLETGHPSGLDIRKIDNSMIGEIKNKFNTTNSSSKKAVLDKLADYKRENPDTICFIGIVNSRNNNSITRTILHNNQEIHEFHGDALIDLIFTYNGINYKDKIVEYVSSIIT